VNNNTLTLCVSQFVYLPALLLVVLASRKKLIHKVYLYNMYILTFHSVFSYNIEKKKHLLYNKCLLLLKECSILGPI
jgi:hypothetical protein